MGPMSIKERFLARQKELLIAGLVLLVSTLSFGLGYTAKIDQEKAPIVIRKCDP